MTPELEPWLQLHGAVTWALVGLIWVVQLVVYPAFALVSAADFPRYHAAHTRNITWVVAPLMLTELGTGAWLLHLGLRQPSFLIAKGLLAFNWLSTWRVQVPLHELLAQGYDATAQQKLVTTNWWRTVAWTLRGGILFFLLSA